MSDRTNGEIGTVHADFGKPQKIQLDGDSFGRVMSVTSSVQPGALRIRMPHAAISTGDHGMETSG